MYNSISFSILPVVKKKITTNNFRIFFIFSKRNPTHFTPHPTPNLQFLSGSHQHQAMTNQFTLFLQICSILGIFMLSKWQHITGGLCNNFFFFYLAQCFQVHPYCSIHQYFITLQGQAMICYMVIPHFTYPFIT